MSLRGRTILLVEDEYFQAMDTANWLERAGARVVGPTGFAEAVPAILASQAIDAAVVDINLGTGPDYEVARSLRDREVPFLFLTGYQRPALPDDLAAVPCLEKPANERKVVQLIEELLRSGPSGEPPMRPAMPSSGGPSG